MTGLAGSTVGSIAMVAAAAVGAVTVAFVNTGTVSPNASAVLMVTGDVDEEARARADDLALPLAAKPYDPADLVRLLAMLMQ
jgi:Skp family chaperone for outer membrane proteins